MVDWDNANVIDLQTGETVLNSILVEPILRGKEVKASSTSPAPSTGKNTALMN